jgi:hypothetical protein
MKTEDLIAKLALEPPPRAKGATGPFAACVVAGLLIAGAIVAFNFGVRPDFASAGTAIALKSAFGAAAALAILPALILLCQPNIKVGVAALAAAVLLGLSVLAAVADLVSAHSLSGLGLPMGVPECLERVPLLAAPMAAMMFFAVRSMAPTRLTLAGAAIGAFSGSVAIIAYAWFCRMDTVAYVAAWYAGAIVICAALGAAVGSRALRWS